MSTESIHRPAPTAFHKTPGWLDFCANPSKPSLVLPAGAVDAHCHVFGPGAVFPYAPSRKYTPCDAPKEKLFALRDYLGFERNVIVQASCHGTDNRALIDALRAAGDRARGVACVEPDVTDAELHELDAAGVRGIRFNFLKRLATPPPHKAVLQVARRIAALGWHIVVYFEAQDLPDIHDLLTALPCPVVIDHMGRPDVTKPVDGHSFQTLVNLLATHDNIWVKVSCPERLSRQGPYALNAQARPYRDVIPFARHLITHFPDRVLWGTDWPHPNMKSHMPDDGLLVNYLQHIAPERDRLERLLVTNPARLYWGEQP